MYNNQMPIVCDSNHFVTTRGFVHAARCLPFHVLLYVKKGTFYVTEEKIDYEIPAGSIFFMKAGLHHYGKHPIARATEWHYIHFYLEQNQPELPIYQPPNKPLSGMEKLESAMQLPKQLFDMKSSEITTKIEELTEYAQSADPYRAFQLNQRTAEILNDIAIWNVRSEKEDSLSDRIARYLIKNQEKKFSAEELASTFFLSYKHLAACFKKEKGLSMQQFHNQVRMERAAHILQSTGTSIAEISEKLGYKDPLYFSRCFHQMYGMSPTKYRQEKIKSFE